MKDLVGSDYRVRGGTRKPTADSSVGVKIADLTDEQLSSAIERVKKTIARYEAGTGTFQESGVMDQYNIEEPVWKHFCVKTFQMLECLENEQASRGPRSHDEG